MHRADRWRGRCRLRNKRAKPGWSRQSMDDMEMLPHSGPAGWDQAKKSIAGAEEVDDATRGHDGEERQTGSRGLGRNASQASQEARAMGTRTRQTDRQTDKKTDSRRMDRLTRHDTTRHDMTRTDPPDVTNIRACAYLTWDALCRPTGRPTTPGCLSWGVKLHSALPSASYARDQEQRPPAAATQFEQRRRRQWQQ
jgi:hypothetical protein